MVTSIENEFELGALTKVYPNPANGNIQIQMEDENILTQIKLVNLVGQTVYEINFPTNLTLRKKEISVTDWASGYYYLTINNASIPRSLVIQ